MNPIREKIDIKFDRWARSTYDRFRLAQPQIKTEGLWQDPNGWTYYIKCKNLPTHSKTLDGEDLLEWFDRSCRLVTSSIKLVEYPPIGSNKIPERSLKEIIQLSGEVLTVSQLVDSFNFLLPKDFPNFLVFDDPKQQEVAIVVKRALNSNEKRLLIKCLKIIQLPVKCRIDINKQIEQKKIIPKNTQNNIDIVPSRSLKDLIPRSLSATYEEDEDFWLSNRVRILGDPEINRDEILPKNWMNLKSTCLIDATVFPPSDIRTYLSLYQNVIIAPPIVTKFDKIYNAFGLSEEDLVELVRLGRVKLILPQPVNRYSQRLLSEIADSCPQNMLFTRRLAGITITASRRKLPLLYPAIGIRDRQIILRSMINFAVNTKDELLKNVFYLLEKTLSEIWLSSEFMMHFRGAMAIDPLGFGRIIGDVIYGLKKQDFRLELGNASKSVEWAGALNSTIFPVDTNEYSEIGHTSIISCAYTGVPNNLTSSHSFRPNKIIKDILAIDQGVPIIDFANSFQGRDIDRFRNCVEALCSQNEYNEAQINEVVSNFNREVSAYERNKKFLCRADLQGLILAIPPLINPTVGSWVTLGMWILGVMSKNRQTVKLGRIFDYFEGVLTRTNSNVVLVGRIKRNIKR